MSACNYVPFDDYLNLLMIFEEIAEQGYEIVKGDDLGECMSIDLGGIKLILNIHRSSGIIPIPAELQLQTLTEDGILVTYNQEGIVLSGVINGVEFYTPLIKEKTGYVTLIVDKSKIHILRESGIFRNIFEIGELVGFAGGPGNYHIGVLGQYQAEYSEYEDIDISIENSCLDEYFGNNPFILQSIQEDPLY